MTENCPCGSGMRYAACCEPYHLRQAAPKTAESLMRSRYAAYVVGLVEYLVETTHPDYRDSSLAEQIATWMERAEFTELKVLRSMQGGERDKMGKVEFQARYLEEGRERVHHELSRFRRYEGRWVYVDGEMMASH